MKEYDLIDSIKNIIDNNLDIIGDDTAVIKENGLVLTCDTLVENTHFTLSTTSAYELGYKAIAVNLSDIAASGGVCKYLLVSLALPEYVDNKFIEDFYLGAKTIISDFNCSIVGGDLTTSQQLVITVTAIGQTQVQAGRSHAKSSQVILTTGSYGASHLGLKVLQTINKTPSNCDGLCSSIKKVTEAHLKPIPRINEAQYFIKNFNYKEYCLMDTSDGLADALYQIANKSNKRLYIYADQIPVDFHTLKLAEYFKVNSIDVALYGGEDFELIFTCDESDLQTILSNKTYKFTVIGNVVDESAGVSIIYNENTVDLTRKLLEKNISFKHF